LNFNTQIIMKQTKITHIEYIFHLRLELLDVAVVNSVIIRSSTYTSITN
jgi:hypothetical protein